MDVVAFITTEIGVDLIVSFAVCVPDDPTRIESFTILRTPKYESILEDWERGATVSFDRGGDREKGLLREVIYIPEEKRATIRCDGGTYELDVRKVDPEEVAAMCRVFRRMNFDFSIRLQGV